MNAPPGASDPCAAEPGEAGAGRGLPRNFRALRVVRAVSPTPRLRRVTLAGERLERFASGPLHVSLLMPEPGCDLPGLRAGPDGGAILAGCPVRRRTYTIRRLDAVAGELDIDFVLHDAPGPGARFALRARPGDAAGIVGPGGGGVPFGGWTLLAGDETALPAIARTLEGLPARARGLVLLEVADAAEEQGLRHPPGVGIRWLHRNGARPGMALRDAARAAEWPAEEPVRCWAACENATASFLRDHWREERGLDRARYRALSTWREGMADGEG